MAVIRSPHAKGRLLSEGLLRGFCSSSVTDVPAFRLQGVSDRRTTYISAAPARVMIDNTHVVVLRGAGRDLIAISSDLSAAQNESNIRIGHGA